MRRFNIFRDETCTVYAEDTLEFPDSRYWGNLSNKLFFIFYRISYDNQLLDSIFSKIDLYKANFKARNGENNDKTSIVPYIEIIHVMSDLRMILDEMIALLYILEQREINGDYPQVINVDSIGVFLEGSKNGDNEDVIFFNDYRDFLKLVNDITNTYKHSFLNDHVLFLRQIKEPTVFALKTAIDGRRRNKFDISKHKLIAISLEKIIDDFNEIFPKYHLLLKEKAYQQMLKDFEIKRNHNSSGSE